MQVRNWHYASQKLKENNNIYAIEQYKEKKNNIVGHMEKKIQWQEIQGFWTYCKNSEVLATVSVTPAALFPLGDGDENWERRVSELWESREWVRVWEREENQRVSERVSYVRTVRRRRGAASQTTVRRRRGRRLLAAGRLAAEREQQSEFENRREWEKVRKFRFRVFYLRGKLRKKN